MEELNYYQYPKTECIDLTWLRCEEGNYVGIHLMPENNIMNIISTEVSLFVVAKTCNYNQACERGMKVTHEFIDTYYSTYLDKRDIITAQLHACEKLIEYSEDENDIPIIKREIEELKMALDLISQ